MFISSLEYKLVERIAKEIFDFCDTELISITEIKETLDNIKNVTDKFSFCSNFETLHYIYSVILAEVRKKKRSVMSVLFEQNPKLAQEKSVLKEKLDVDEDYAKLHHQEELLFSFIEHIENIIKSVTYMIKEDENI